MRSFSALWPQGPKPKAPQPPPTKCTWGPTHHLLLLLLPFATQNREKNELKQKLTLLLTTAVRTWKGANICHSIKKTSSAMMKTKNFPNFSNARKAHFLLLLQSLLLSKRSKRGGRRHLAYQSWSLLCFFPRVVALFEITSNPLGFVCFASRCISMPTTTNSYS